MTGVLPADDPQPVLEDAAEREGARKAFEYMLRLVEEKGIVAKIIGLNFALRKQSQSMAQVGKRYGIGRAAICRHRTIFCDLLGLPAGKTDFQRAELREITTALHKLRRRNSRPRKENS